MIERILKALVDLEAQGAVAPFSVELSQEDWDALRLEFGHGTGAIPWVRTEKTDELGSWAGLRFSLNKSGTRFFGTLPDGVVAELDERARHARPLAPAT